MQPSRQDMEIYSGATNTLEFELWRNHEPRNITNTDVDLYIAHAYGKAWRVQKISLANAHHDAANGIVRFELTAADVPSQRHNSIAWFEVWHRGDNVPHIVGELRIIGSVR